MLTSITDSENCTNNQVAQEATRQKEYCKKNTAKRWLRKKPWFDYDCIIARSLLNKVKVKYNDDPTVETYRTNLFNKNKSYRKILSNKKSKYLTKQNRDIEEGKNICWDKFQKLKRQTTSSEAGS